MTSLMNARAFVAERAPDNDLGDRLDRLVFASDEQRMAALAFLAGFAPETFDAIMDAAEPDSGELACAGEPEPRCARCQATIGVFLSHGLAWQHYRGDGVTPGEQEVFFPGHEPVPYAEPAACRAAGADHCARVSARKLVSWRGVKSAEIPGGVQPADHAQPGAGGPGLDGRP